MSEDKCKSITYDVYALNWNEARLLPFMLTNYFSICENPHHFY